MKNHIRFLAAALPLLLCHCAHRRYSEPSARELQQHPELQPANFPKRLQLLSDMLAADADDGRISLSGREKSRQGKPFTEPLHLFIGVVPKGTRLSAVRVEICKTYAFPWAGMVYQIESGPMKGKLVNPVQWGWKPFAQGRASRHEPEFLQVVE